MLGRSPFIFWDVDWTIPYTAVGGRSYFCLSLPARILTLHYYGQLQFQLDLHGQNRQTSIQILTVCAEKGVRLVVFLPVSSSSHFGFHARANTATPLPQPLPSISTARIVASYEGRRKICATGIVSLSLYPVTVLCPVSD